MFVLGREPDCVGGPLRVRACDLATAQWVGGMNRWFKDGGRHLGRGLAGKVSRPLLIEQVASGRLESGFRCGRLSAPSHLY